jgi:hypothetical protein
MFSFQKKAPATVDLWDMSAVFYQCELVGREKNNEPLSYVEQKSISSIRPDVRPLTQMLDISEGQTVFTMQPPHRLVLNQLSCVENFLVSSNSDSFEHNTHCLDLGACPMLYNRIQRRIQELQILGRPRMEYT